jgi:high-affinity iron transporter
MGINSSSKFFQEAKERNMLETALITFREGIEAFLIIAITLLYLNRTGRSHLNSSVYAGISAAVLASIGGGFMLQSINNGPLVSGSLTIFAALLVISFTFYMMRAGKHMKRQIETGLNKNAEKSGVYAYIGVFLFTVLMISREGMETTLLITTLMNQVEAQPMIIGACAGVVAAAGLGALWMRYARHINIGLFLQVTAVFLLVFSLQLVAYGIHELTEAVIIADATIPMVDIYYLHNATEDWAHDGMIAQILSYGLIALPISWLITAMLKQHFVAKPVAA